MAKFSVKPIIRGHQKVKRKALRLKERIQRKASRRAVDKAMTPVGKAAKQKAPRREGKYKRTIRKERAKTRSNGITEGRITSGHPLAWILEHGTKPHKIRAKKARRLKFTVAGKAVFALETQHPGSKPQPHFRPALEDNRQIALDIYFREIEAGVKAETEKAALR